MYELIRIGSVCRNYADIEWIGDRDDSHTKIRALIQKIRDFTEREFKIKPALYVCCSSREKDGCYKNSYHVVFRDLHYENNHGGPMKQFWTDLCLELDSEEWKCPTDKKHIIDHSVYTNNRNMRLPLASKRGGAPFKRISGDPFDESDDFTSEYADENHEAWEPFFVSDPPRDSNTVLGSDRIHARPSKKRKTQHHNTTDVTSSIDTSRNEMFIETDSSPVTDTSSGTDLADMSDVHDVMETDDEKEQALHCDEYNENLTGGVGDGAGVPQKNPGKIDVQEEIAKDDDAGVIDAKDIVAEISLYITKFKKERSAMHDTWTKMLLCIMDICRTNNVEERECANLCHQFSEISGIHNQKKIDRKILKE